MNTQQIFDAAAVYNKISQMQYYVTKERYCTVALAKHGITDEEEAQELYNLFSSARKVMLFINTEHDRKKFTERFPLAIQIAEETYEIYYRQSSMPCIPTDKWANKDIRRYYVIDTANGNEPITFDADFSQKVDVIAFAELLKREGIEIKGVSHVLGKLEHQHDGSKGDALNYFEGDIIFVHGDPTDSMWQSYYHRKEEGVYLATDRGFRKLLYTPGRGYVDSRGKVEFENDKDFYDEHIIQGLCRARDFLVVGNIHKNISVLVDKDFDVEEEGEE